MKLRRSIQLNFCMTLAALSPFMLSPFISSMAWGQLAIRGGTVMTMAGEDIADGVILIRDGRIEAVGSGLEIPSEYKVIDAAGHVVMPGYIDIHNSAGMSQANEQNNNVPFLSVLDTINPQADYFEECRRNGITTANVVPGNSTMIGGQAAVVKTAGAFVNDMAVDRLAGMKLSMSPATGSRMGQIAALRRELNKAKLKKEEGAETVNKDADQEKGEAKEGETTENSESTGEEGAASNAAPSAAQEQQGLEVLGKLIGGELLAFIYCDNSMDVGQAMRLIDEFQLRPVMVLGKDCEKAAKLLADKKYPVVMHNEMVFWRSNPRTREDELVSMPKTLNALGVSYMFQADTSSSRTTLGSNYLWFQAATAVKNGLSREAALKACTIDPAKTLGIESHVGTIEVGKDADLVILTGDPLATKSWVSKTIIDGVVVYDRTEDPKLRRLLESTEK